MQPEAQKFLGLSLDLSVVQTTDLLRAVSENMFLHLIYSKCVPILIYGILCFQLQIQTMRPYMIFRIMHGWKS